MPCHAWGNTKDLQASFPPKPHPIQEKKPQRISHLFQTSLLTRELFFVLEEKNIIVSQSLSQYIQRLGPHSHLSYYELT